MAAMGARCRGPETYGSFTYEHARLHNRPLLDLRRMVQDALRVGCASVTTGREVQGRRSIDALVNYAGDCERPVLFRYRGQPEGFLWPVGVRAYHVTSLVKCKTCQWCKLMRACGWGHRVEEVCNEHVANWLGTVTLSPFEHSRIDMLRDRVVRRTKLPEWFIEEQGSFDAAQAEAYRKDVFRARCAVFSKWLTSWLEAYRERRRRALGRRPEFKYLMVAEEHKSGLPHFHLLLHEKEWGELVRLDEMYSFWDRKHQTWSVRVDDAAGLRKTWVQGFTSFELVRDAHGASYVCKYLSKEMLWRVRASLRYCTSDAESPEGEPERLAEGAAFLGLAPAESGDAASERSDA